MKKAKKKEEEKIKLEFLNPIFNYLLFIILWILVLMMWFYSQGIKGEENYLNALLLLVIFITLAIKQSYASSSVRNWYRYLGIKNKNYLNILSKIHGVLICAYVFIAIISDGKYILGFLVSLSEFFFSLPLILTLSKLIYGKCLK